MSQHPIVHVEIPAADQAASGQFYSDLFGWKYSAYPEMDYAMFEAEGGPVQQRCFGSIQDGVHQEGLA